MMIKTISLFCASLLIPFFSLAQSLPANPSVSRYQVDTIPLVYELIEMVDTGEFMPSIRHLSSYETRLCTSPEALEAQDWIKTKLEGYGLTVEIQDFPYYGGSSSDNVIATLPGKTKPDEYVIVGGHYDSFTWFGPAPGADDNASGTSGMIETARILSQFEFERSLIFCAWSAEEVGLIGSDYYAYTAKQADMDILGYFNFDMIGYLHPGNEIHTDMIAPASAQELVDFYTGVAGIYLPEFGIFPAEPIGGSSDHASFNNYGYMGIFPFEDTPNYSPYIHTVDDVVGLSVNSPEMAKTFIQATLASLATLAVPYDNTIGTGPENEEGAVLSVFPNPASDQVLISTDYKQPMRLRITSMAGKTVLTTEFTGKTRIDVSDLPAGIYVVNCSGTPGNLIAKLIVR